MDKKLKHLEMVQSIINRMSRNCFYLKGWAITLVTLVGTMASKDTDNKQVLLVFVPIIGFCLMDAYYLLQERRFRSIYRVACQKRDEDIDFDMDYRKIKYTEEEKRKNTYCRCLCSVSVSLFYGVLVGAVVVWCFICK